MPSASLIRWTIRCDTMRAMARNGMPIWSAMIAPNETAPAVTVLAQSESEAIEKARVILAISNQR